MDDTVEGRIEVIASFVGVAIADELVTFISSKRHCGLEPPPPGFTKS